MYYGLYKQEVSKRQIKTFYLNVDRAIFLQMTFPFGSASTLLFSNSHNRWPKIPKMTLKFPRYTGKYDCTKKFLLSTLYAYTSTLYY